MILYIKKITVQSLMKNISLKIKGKTVLRFEKKLKLNTYKMRNINFIKVISK
jgi:hypothetical protein